MRTLTTVLIGLGAIAGTTGITGAATAEDLKVALIYGKHRRARSLRQADRNGAPPRLRIRHQGHR